MLFLNDFKVPIHNWRQEFAFNVASWGWKLHQSGEREPSLFLHSAFNRLREQRKGLFSPPLCASLSSFNSQSKLTTKDVHEKRGPDETEISNESGENEGHMQVWLHKASEGATEIPMEENEFAPRFFFFERVFSCFRSLLWFGLKIN